MKAAVAKAKKRAAEKHAQRVTFGGDNSQNHEKNNLHNPFNIKNDNNNFNSIDDVSWD